MVFLKKKINKFVFVFFSFLILLFFLVSLSSCTNKNTDSVVLNNNIDDKNNIDSNNVVLEDNNETFDSNNVDEAFNSNFDNDNFMKHCVSRKNVEDLKYEFFISKNKIFEKTSSISEGSLAYNEKIADNVEHKLCMTSYADSDSVNWGCIDMSDKDFFDYKNSIDELINGPLSGLFDFDCETIPYDEAVFLIKK